MTTAIASAHARVEVREMGGIVWRPEFRLPDGTWIAPLAEAPWAGTIGDDADLLPYLAWLGGAFVALPFGGRAVDRDAVDDWQPWSGIAAVNPLHGAAATGRWVETARIADSVTLRLELPNDGLVAALEQTVTCDAIHPAIEVALAIEPAQSGKLALGFHPILRLPDADAPAQIAMDFANGHTHPNVLGDQSKITAGATFDALCEVPTRSGGTISLETLPSTPGMEDVVLLADVEGPIRVTYPQGYAVCVDWDRTQLPNCLLWISDDSFAVAGATRFRGIGIEPSAAAFDLAPQISASANPLTKAGVRTALALEAGEPVRTWCRISIEPSEDA